MCIKDNKEEILTMFKECIPLLNALADETRQRIILILAEEEGLNVNMITERLSLSRPAISHHLKLLKQVGIIDMERKGTENYYYLTLKDSVQMIKSFINTMENNCDLK
ncbi:ArsR family transcriptional regulator [Fervidicella metallireducens AeB]|uniref:ArsR family transcriptional regulator n=1 Tax=Fervidicella metallireducens AeB TaxID=1403537 RepID=A0A017RY92_9CLOT|nr:metalloregulator ArsR/SmtB family transcription factor [Fervidicella metallireducens]EYE88910.1 ArsR family transcriptional regulator [Fervidicella metallireducens AeB]